MHQLRQLTHPKHDDALSECHAFTDPECHSHADGDEDGGLLTLRRGAVGARLHVAARRKGQCQESNVLQRPDALRCFLDQTYGGGNVIDPCFQNEEVPVVVACVDDPGSTAALVVVPTGPLPLDHGGSGDPMAGNAWIIELTDGQSCGFLGGATTTVAGVRDNDGCAHGDLYGSPVRSQPIWTILYRAKGAATLTKVPIRTAYF